MNGRRYEPTCFVGSYSEVFHRHGELRNTDQDAIFWQWYTACGKRINPMWGINTIGRPRAELLGRPCGKCYPKDGDA